MSDDLSKLPFTVRLSRKALTVIKQNIWFSLLVKAAFLLLTVLGLSNLWMAVFADTGAALIFIANGMRLMKSYNEKEINPISTKELAVRY